MKATIGAARIGIHIRGCVSILYPKKLAVIYDDVGIAIELQERRHMIYPLLDVAAIKKLAIFKKLIADKNVDIAQLPAKGQLAQERVEMDTTIRLVAREDIGISLWIIEFG